MHHPQAAVVSFFEPIHFSARSRAWRLSAATPGTVYSASMYQVAPLAHDSSCFLVICEPSATIPARYMASELPVS